MNNKIIKTDKFLSNILKKKCFVINPNYINLIKIKKKSFYQLSINSILKKDKKILKNKKFRLMEKFYLFFGKIIKKKNKHQKNIKITEAKISDKKRVIDKSFLKFPHSRFFKDNKISKKKAFLIHKKWIENYFEGQRADKMYIATYHNKIAGFLLLFINNNEAIIDLINIKKKFRKKKIATNLLCEFMNKNKKVKYLYAGTQKTNRSSRIFYKSLGLKIKKTYYNYHLHT